MTPPLAWLVLARRAPRLTLHLAGESDGPARISHCWYPDGGDDVVRGGHGVEVLNLPSLSPASLIGALHLIPENKPGPAPSMLFAADGVVTFADDKGRAQAVSGSITIRGRTLRFFGIRNFEFRPED